MAKITKTKSGKYHTKVFLGMDLNGKKIEKSVTAPTVREVKQIAAKLLTENSSLLTYDNITLEEAYNRYIESRSNTLSPSTYMEYHKAAKNDFPMLLYYRLNQLNNNIIQTAVNEIAGRNKPKTVYNKFYFLSAVLKAYCPDLRLNIKLPQKIKPKEYVPTFEDVHTLLENADPSIKVPILLIAFGGLRRSEIVAIRPEDFTDFGVIIDKARVKGEGGFYEKQPKSDKGYRTPPLSPALIRECKQWQYFGMSPNTLGNKYRRLRKQCGIEFPFHQLRHFYCATLIKEKLDFKTIMEYGGWSSLDMILKVYGYMMKDEENDTKIISIYSKFITKKSAVS